MKRAERKQISAHDLTIVMWSSEYFGQDKLYDGYVVDLKGNKIFFHSTVEMLLAIEKLYKLGEQRTQQVLSSRNQVQQVECTEFIEN